MEILDCSNATSCGRWSQLNTHIGRIGLLQQLLGDAETDAATMARYDLPELEKLARELERRLSKRG